MKIASTLVGGSSYRGFELLGAELKHTKNTNPKSINKITFAMTVL